MKNTMGKRVDEEREEKSKNRFTIRNQVGRQPNKMMIFA
jgi:hypothetical protein